MKVVIIGGVAGGASAAARLRRLDEKAEIMVFERGEYISYANCGLPYHVGGVIEERDELLLMTPELMKDRFNIDVRVRSEVTAIDRAGKSVEVKGPDGKLYRESYDKLLIATGSSPLRPPIPGIDSERIMSLWTVGDTDRIKAAVKEGVKSAAVIGGGFIGLEMAENLRHLGLEVSVIEAQNQVMAPLDYEMALPVHARLREAGVMLYLGDGVDSFEDREHAVSVKLRSGAEVRADLVILSIGVRPNGELARNAGLGVNRRGGIVVDQEMRTEDPDIFAVGDAVEVRDLVSGEQTMIPLAGPANKQGRIVAANILGGHEKYKGSLGTSVVKLFDTTVAATGANEKALNSRGQEEGRDYRRIIIRQNSHAGYYPNAEPMYLKLLFAADGSRILGAQIVGGSGVDKRIDTIATAMRLSAPVRELAELELAYAPPYSSAKDPVNMAGFVAGNVLDGLTSFAAWDAIDGENDAQILDVREDWEVEYYAIPKARVIPLGELRGRLGELDQGKEIIVFCAAGVRAHTAAQMLRNNGFGHVKVYPGGAYFYEATHKG